MWEIVGLKIFLENNNDVISVLIGIISIIVSGFGVHFGKKAYDVAKEIFEKGIQIDQQKVLQQISLEFVIGFFLPLSNFRNATADILDHPCDKKVLVVRELIKDKRFRVEFPYLNVHKGEVWDAVNICKDMEQFEAFNTIMKFEEEARNFDRIIADLCDRLDVYLDSNDPEERQRRADSTMNDFFDTCPSMLWEMQQHGLKLIDELSQYENKLPKELKIPEMKKKLFRGL